MKWILDTLRRLFRWLTAQRAKEPAKKTRLRERLQQKLIARRLKRFLRERYELRYNTLKQTEEFRPRQSKLAASRNLAGGFENLAGGFENLGGGFENFAGDFEKNSEGFRQLTDREFRRIAFEYMEQVGYGWSVDVELYVRSALVQPYNPVTDFLARCGTWDGQTDYIGDMARRVPTAYAAWPDLFHRWLLGMVAQWLQLSRDYGNALVPMLIGRQGTHKSTFCKLLLPPALREYYIDDVKLDSAEQVERMLGRMMLCCIDEYNAKTDREQAKIKRLLTERDVQTRRMRSDQYVMVPRMASFIATTNEREPLTDPTGSRRYLCCEVTGIIDTSTPIDYRGMYAQAVSELQAGERYYLTSEEEAALEQHNADYRRSSSPEELLTAWYEPAPHRKEYLMRAADILEGLSRHVRAADLPSLKMLTLALRAAHFGRARMGSVKGWYAKPLNVSEL